MSPLRVNATRIAETGHQCRHPKVPSALKVEMRKDINETSPQFGRKVDTAKPEACRSVQTAPHV
jgi:hypothetical protein